jgi:hypothetical protein
MELEKGLTVRGIIIISKPEKPITVEIYNPDGDIIARTRRFLSCIVFSMALMMSATRRIRWFMFNL